MKKLIYLIVILFITVLTSCKKQPTLHKIKYRIEFNQTPDYGYTNWLELSVAPVYSTEYNYGDQYPSISPKIASVNKEWEYDYWELKSGDKITFGLWTSKNYYYRLYVYIDGDLVSTKRIFQGDGFIDIDEQSGLDDDPNDTYINFTYYE